MEIWCALLNGAAMLIVPHDYLFDFEKLSLYLQTNNVTSLFIPSKLFTEYSQQNPAMFAHLKYLFIGGDKLNVESVNKVRQDNNQLRIFNLYGPTENTTNTTCYEIPLARIIENPVPIGKPISNTKVYVLDDSKNPLPVGIPGELYIAGDGLSDGYLNDDVLTKTKFIELEIKNLPNKIRAYRSGDIVRWLSDGNLQFLGRKDRQVKINDVRLELDEIESYVVKLIKIQKCFVDYYESTGVIVYYIGDVDGDYLKNYLTQFFPSYHLPNRIIQIESLPFNTNGKVDRELLKNMYLKNNNLLSNDNTCFFEIIADIWRSVLKHNDFCYDSSFFDVGGTSIKVMTLNVLLDEKLGVKINPAMLFNLPTISNIAHHIKTNSQAMPVKLLSLVSAEESKHTNKIAIIAMNLRVPNANDVSSFWDKLIGGCELISKSNFPNDAGIILGVLEDYKYFSPVKYGISEREAELLDPQQRILLEMADDLLSDSGYIKSYNGKIGVFTGSGFNYYLPSNIYNNFSEFSDHEKSLAISANEKDFLATRIAYKLDLKGPAVVIGTACSSSLVAIIKACESLLSRESDMAIAGGISLVYPDALTFLPSESALYSKTNQCRPFSADSDGTLQSSGAGLVLLKRLDDAIHDKDEIIAVIDGYSVNNDGSNKQSFYSPNIDSQAENIQNALNKVNITADDIMYFETHGTATSLGDAVEIAAMNKIFNNRNDGDVSLGSVKANIGHTDAASGVIGLIKVALMLKNAVIPPQINFVKLNPLLEDMFQPFKVLTSQYNLSNRELKKYFGVSSLGVGGTNAHVLLTGYHLPDKIKIETKCITSKSCSKKIFWLNDNKKINTRFCDKDIEAELSSIWSQVTGIDNINKNDNFFDLGGDSLSAVSLCTNVNNRFGINLECNDILQFNTIERQLEFIFNKRNVDSSGWWRHFLLFKVCKIS
jgi:polyketide synthase PksJ